MREKSTPLSSSTAQEAKNTRDNNATKPESNPGFLYKQTILQTLLGEGARLRGLKAEPGFKKKHSRAKKRQRTFPDQPRLRDSHDCKSVENTQERGADEEERGLTQNHPENTFHRRRRHRPEARDERR